MKVLVVENEPAMQTLLVELLTYEGYEVNTAHDGESAMTMLAAGDYPVVVTDLRLGTMSGQEILEQVKAGPSAKLTDVIILTGHANMSSAISALRHGAFDYLQKPLMTDDFLACVGRAAEHQRLLRDNQSFRKKLSGLRGKNRKVSQALATYREELARITGVAELTVASEQMREVVELAMVLHRDRSVPVMIQGETGTGKELVARLVHHGDKMQSATPFVDLNCAAIAPTLFESELFGYEGGAFTGADPKGRMGKLELANGGSVFLDEIAECPLVDQAKLLRVLEEREVRRVGGSRKCKLDVRFICATNRDVEELVRDGQFRADLYYRLHVGIIRLAPLREQPESIEPLAQRFLRQFSTQRGKDFAGVADDALAAMLAYPWPGNIRELKNLIDRAVLLHNDVVLRASHLGLSMATEFAVESPAQKMAQPGSYILPPEGVNLEEIERELVSQALAMCDHNKSQAARLLGLSRSKFLSRLGRLND